MSDSAIFVKNLSKDYRGIQAVRRINFSVPEGILFGFLGPNGAGKTTTVKMLCTLTRPTDGEAFVAGHSVLSSPIQVRQSIGIVFQEPSLDDRLTAYENLQFHGILYGMRGARLRKRIQEMLELVELSGKARARVKTFSGGMKRRLEIARGLMHTPKVLFLDEPTIGLDPQTRLHIWDYLRSLRNTQGVTLFLTTHYLEEAENCDRIAVIDHGEIIALDTPSQLKAKIRGNIVILNTEENQQTAEFLKEKFPFPVTVEKEGVRLEISEPEKILPAIFRELPIPVKELHWYSPSLEEVFLHLTGSKIREETASWRDVAKRVVRRRASR